jgi:hypothetical protein
MSQLLKTTGAKGKHWATISLAMLVLQPLIFYKRHLFWMTAHIPFDIQEFHLPLAAFIERSLLQGVLPLWDPLRYTGVPIHADIQAQLFYPLTWLAILMDSLTGATRLFYWLEWLEPIHMMIAGIGVYALLRKLQCLPLVSFFGATVFQIGPFFVSQAEHLGAISVAAWFPIVLLCLVQLKERMRLAWIGALGLAVAMSFLAGFPAATFVSLTLSAFFGVALVLAGFARWPFLFRIAAGYLLGVGIAAIQLIPTLELSRLSVASLRYQWLGNGGGLHWESLVSFVWPNYYHIFTPWEASYGLPYEFTFMFTFCGHVSLLLLLLAPFLLKRSRMLTVMVLFFVISAVWMLGEQTPIYPAIFLRLPNMLRGSLYADFGLLGFGLFAAATSALVLSQFQNRIPTVLLFLLAALNSWNLLRVGAGRAFNTFPGSYKVATTGFADGGRMMPDALRELMESSDPPTRMTFLSPQAAHLRETADLFGLYSADGDNPFFLLRYYRLRRLLSDDGETSRLQYLRDPGTPWARALNVGYAIEDANAPVRASNDNYELLPFNLARIYAIKNTLPRFRLTNRIRRVDNDREGLTVAADTHFDPTRETIVEGLPPDWKPAETISGSVEVFDYGNNQVKLRVKSSGRAVLVASESFYPGWTATVNEKTTRIFPTNVAFRGIPVEEGESEVVMRYVPQRFYAGIAVSLVALLVTAVLLSASRKG